MANRVLIGKHASLGYGLYVSKPGKDAKSDTGGDLIYSSATAGTGGNSALHSILTLTLSSGQSSVSGSISGLGYVPMVTWGRFDGSTTTGIGFTNTKSYGGGSARTSGPHGVMLGGRSASAFSHWQCKVTSSSVTIGSWIKDTHYYSGQFYDTADLLHFPPDDNPYGDNGQVTSDQFFKVLVYRIPATS